MKKLLRSSAIIAAIVFLMSCACPPSVIEEPGSRLALSSKYFNPAEENITIFLPELQEFPVENWKVRILEPQYPFNAFYEWTGEGKPPSELVWDGKSHKGQWAHSASDYPVVYTASCTQGDTRAFESKIVVDVFAVPEGSDLRITVPSIVFGANSENWNGLDPETIANNEWILSRLALALNKHSEYQVLIEGHANSTVNPENMVEHWREQVHELQPLSEMRARTVADKLVELNVDGSRLTYYGAGGEYPVAAWEDHDNWWKNRRVEFILKM